MLCFPLPLLPRSESAFLLSMFFYHLFVLFSFCSLLSLPFLFFSRISFLYPPFFHFNILGNLLFWFATTTWLCLLFYTVVHIPFHHQRGMRTECCTLIHGKRSEKNVSTWLVQLPQGNTCVGSLAPVVGCNARATSASLKNHHQM